jgi:hypothetical protein
MERGPTCTGRDEENCAIGHDPTEVKWSYLHILCFQAVAAPSACCCDYEVMNRDLLASNQVCEDSTEGI